MIAEVRRFTTRLYENTEFDRLIKHGAANLFYVVANPGVVSPRALPCGWGLLERAGEALALKVKPHRHEVSEDARLAFFQRISLAATRSVNRGTVL